MSDPRNIGSEDTARIPPALRLSAAVSWRVLLILGLLYVLGIIVGRLFIVVIPVAIALLLAALLAPAVSALHRLRVPRSLATAIVLVGGMAALGGLLTFVINAFIAGLPDMQAQIVRSIDNIHQWLLNGPLPLNQQQLDEYVRQIQEWLKGNRAWLTSGALATASSLGNFLTGLALMLFTLIFFLHDGRRIWKFLLRMLPASSRDRIDAAGMRGFASLSGYIRGTGLVAVGDALGIGIGLAVLGVPLAVPLAALVFLSAFVPIVGAIASGVVAVLVALVTKGPITGLLVLAVVLGVQQIEGNVLQPLVIGRAVKLHPLAVVLAISAGVVVAGIAGALLAVPLLAVLNAAIRSLAAGEDDADAVSSLRPRDSLPPKEEPAGTETAEE